VINQAAFAELMRTKDARLFHREGQELEFKEQFNFAGLADYFRDFAAFANNRGGILVFGVQDSPRIPIGLSQNALEQFEKLDPERITGYLLDIFSADIRWDQAVFEVDNKGFGVLQIFEASTKPVIAKKNEGKGQQILNGAIYYRYAGRTQTIQYAELQAIIDKRVEANNTQWRDLVSKISKAGPQNVAILDTEKGVIEKDDRRVLLIDQTLADKIKFVREGEFDIKNGATTLKLVGDVVPIETVEVVKFVKENLTRQYPLSAMELAVEVKKVLPSARTNRIWDIVKENDMKNNENYAVHNFRNKKQEDAYHQTGKLPSVTPTIYNERAVEFILNVLRTERK
jgi:schlafen family protein